MRYVAYLRILPSWNATIVKESAGVVNSAGSGDTLKTKIVLETLPVFDTTSARVYSRS